MDETEPQESSLWQSWHVPTASTEAYTDDDVIQSIPSSGIAPHRRSMGRMVHSLPIRNINYHPMNLSTPSASTVIEPTFTITQSDSVADILTKLLPDPLYQVLKAYIFFIHSDSEKLTPVATPTSVVTPTSGPLTFQQLVARIQAWLDAATDSDTDSE